MCVIPISQVMCIKIVNVGDCNKIAEPRSNMEREGEEMKESYYILWSHKNGRIPITYRICINDDAITRIYSLFGTLNVIKINATTAIVY